MEMCEHQDFIGYNMGNKVSLLFLSNSILKFSKFCTFTIQFAVSQNVIKEMKSTEKLVTPIILYIITSV